MPPPTKIASGAGRPSRTSGAPPRTTVSSGTPSASALCVMRAARSSRRSTATARAVRSARSHSTAIEPLPAPTSHSSSPGNGARAATVSARTWRLVSCPSDANASSGSPGVRARAGPPATSTATTWRGSAVWPVASWAVTSTRRSCGPPSCSRTVKALGPKPRSVSTRARRAAPSVPVTYATIRRPGCSARTMTSAGRATALTSSTSPCAQPRRAHASANADGCGITSTRPGPALRTSVAPTPCSIGSPLASTTTSPAAAPASSSTSGSIGDGQARRVPAASAGSRSS